MKHIVSLRPYHGIPKVFQHPLLDGVVTYTDYELDKLVDESKDDPDFRSIMLDALRGCLKNTVGRYLYHWPITRSFTDDMVSEGFTALCEIPLDKLSKHGILEVAARRIQDKINLFLNKNQSLASPCLRKQKYLQKDGEDPIYMSQSMDYYCEAVQPLESGDEWKRDMLDTVNKIKLRDQIDTAIMSPLNWGRKHQELADELNIDVSTVSRRKKRLYKQFLQLTR
jgi:hypothetical protein